MRGRLIHWPGVLCYLVPVIVAIVLIAATALLRHHARPPVASTSLPAPSEPLDPLMRELMRCQNLGARAEDDPECLAAWSENRRRFFNGADIVDGAPDAPSGRAAGSASQP